MPFKTRSLPGKLGRRVLSERVQMRDRLMLCYDERDTVLRGIRRMVWLPYGSRR